jgi:hypothetical protein
MLRAVCAAFALPLLPALATALPRHATAQFLTRNSGAPGIAVRGNSLVTTGAGTLGVRRVRAGETVVLRGVNLSGAEYACISQGSVWDNPPGDPATVAAMLTWHVNVVRVPLDEECWLGINGAPKGLTARQYRAAIAAFVTDANAGAHVYFDGLGCEDAACWTSEYGKIQAAGYPVVVDETGEFDCGHAKIDRLMSWADARSPQIGYWAWSWNPFDCGSGPSLITNDAGTPTRTYGSGFRQHLLSVQ